MQERFFAWRGNALAEGGAKKSIRIPTGTKLSTSERKPIHSMRILFFGCKQTCRLAVHRPKIEAHANRRH